jgi:hypothetical protein
VSAYATPNDVRLAANPLWVEGSPEPNAAAQDASSLSDEQLTAAIVQASARIDSYIGARYQTPVAEVLDDAGQPLEPVQYPDEQIKFWTVDIALFLATLTYLRQMPMGPQSPVMLRYQSAMADLVSVRDGKSVLALPPAVSGDAVDSSGGYAGVVDPGTGGLFDAGDAGFHRRGWAGAGYAPPWTTGDRVVW